MNGATAIFQIGLSLGFGLTLGAAFVFVPLVIIYRKYMM